MARRLGLAAVALLLATGLAGCSIRPAAQPPAPTLILVSLDGFRSDYFERLPTPNLHRLAARGVRAARLIPSFPSKTFPNHYTLVTGRYPEHHGIVANDMWDSSLEAGFSLGDRAAIADARWWQAEPIWVTAERQGMRTAPIFWPGSEAAIGGLRPTWFRPFDWRVSAEERVQATLDLLAPSDGTRPGFVTLYLQDTDDAGHDFGPSSSELAQAVARVDAALGRLLAGIERLGRTESTDVVVVSDHGMAATPPERAIFLDGLVDPDRDRVTGWSPLLGLWPDPTRLGEVEAALRAVATHFAVYRRGEVPARFHYDDNPRIPPLLALADEGWHFTLRSRAGSAPLGEHGYDPALPSMGALFVAAGPSFRRGVVLPAFENLEVYPLLCRALGIEPRAGDWTAAALPAALRPPSRAVAGSIR